MKHSESTTLATSKIFSGFYLFIGNGVLRSKRGKKFGLKRTFWNWDLVGAGISPLIVLPLCQTHACSHTLQSNGVAVLV